MAFQINIPDFDNGGRIPRKFTCDGQNVSPRINWKDAPENTVSFALLCEDPDAPYKTFVHWIVYNIPPHISSLEESIPTVKKLKNNAIQANTDFGKPGYGGPCPPKGKDHHYYFRLFALNTILAEGAIIDRESFYKITQENVVAKTEYMGLYNR